MNPSRGVQPYGLPHGHAAKLPAGAARSQLASYVKIANVQAERDSALVLHRRVSITPTAPGSYRCVAGNENPRNMKR
ncbi:MAG: hypothetical protein AB7H80_01740 [Candidatus Kapaibacterium sp.]